MSAAQQTSVGLIVKPNHKFQRGLGLVEMLVSMSLSLMAVAAMIILVSSTLGSSSTTIQMSRLSQEMRASLQLMSRDLRRANFHSGYLSCFANVNCRSDLGIDSFVDTIHINADGNCFWYWLDRNADANLTNDAVGAFRLSNIEGIGTIQMRVAGNSAANCDATDGWELITDPGIVEITGFAVSNSDSYTESLTSGGDVQIVEKIRLSINGRMISDPSIQKEIQDLVLVRNDIQSASS
jgi:hypothetical protein